MNAQGADSEQRPIRDFAPGFTVAAIDDLTKDAWVDGYWHGRNEGNREMRPEVEESRRVGLDYGRIEAENWVWVNCLRVVEQAEERLDKLRINTKFTKAQSEELAHINATLNRALLAWERRKATDA